MTRLIDADKLERYVTANSSSLLNEWDTAGILLAIGKQPTVDAVEVVIRCKDCTLHDNCSTEDVFKFAGIENPFCCVGKRKEDV